MDLNYWVGEPPTGTVYIGYERGTWPLVVFAKPEHAAAWLAKGQLVRYVWRYELTGAVPMALVPEVRTAATLIERKAPDGPQPA